MTAGVTGSPEPNTAKHLLHTGHLLVVSELTEASGSHEHQFLHQIGVVESQAQRDSAPQ